MLEAGYKVLPDMEAHDTEISEKIYFHSALLPWPDSQSLTAEELDCFCKGLRLVRNQIQETVRNRPCLITLRSIRFSDCNIQNDAFTACAIQWASEAFGFPMPVVNVSFDALEVPCGKYIFDFSQASIIKKQKEKIACL